MPGCLAHALVRFTASLPFDANPIRVYRSGCLRSGKACSCYRTHAVVEVQHFFSDAVHLRSSTPHPKTDLGGKQKGYPMNNPMTEVCNETYCSTRLKFRRFSGEGAKTCYLYRGTPRRICYYGCCRRGCRIARIVYNVMSYNVFFFVAEIVVGGVFVLVLVVVVVLADGRCFKIRHKTLSISCHFSPRFW